MEETEITIEIRGGVLQDVTGLPDGMTYRVLDWDDLMHEHPKTDYKHCVTCNTIFDLWKYSTVKDTGHDSHELRDLTDEEYNETLREDFEDGCFDE